MPDHALNLNPGADAVHRIVFMSTHRLSRTVIEPGRTSRMKTERINENRGDRRAARMEAHALARDPYLADGEAGVRREPVRVAQRDKLRPLENWLDAQVGRPWDEVYAEIRASVDTRTTAGRHILYDHLLRDVEGNGITREGLYFGYRREWWIDEDGILRGHSRRLNTNYLWWKAYERREEKRAEIAAFVDFRRVRELGAELFWMEPVLHNLTVRHRQGRRFDENEAAIWRAFDEAVRREFLWMAPETIAR